MKRDSKAWWLGMAVAMLTFVMSRWDLIDPLLPAAHTDKIHALIELVSMLVGVGSAKMSASPLNEISDAGKRYYQDKADGL